MTLHRGLARQGCLHAGHRDKAGTADWADCFGAHAVGVRLTKTSSVIAPLLPLFTGAVFLLLAPRSAGSRKGLFDMPEKGRACGVGSTVAGDGEVARLRNGFLELKLSWRPGVLLGEGWRSISMGSGCVS